MYKNRWNTAEEIYGKKLRKKKIIISTYIAITIAIVAVVTVLLNRV
ncbi:hypothetical protein [Peribacillus sp. SCS-155]